MSALIKRLDIEFSVYIRMRDCPDNNGRCISCGNPITFETCDAGHFIPRIHMTTRFDERNVNAQCRHCNRCLDGNEDEYRRGLTVKYGNDTIDELESLKRQTMKFSQSELREMINFYKHGTTKEK